MRASEAGRFFVGPRTFGSDELIAPCHGGRSVRKGHKPLSLKSKTAALVMRKLPYLPVPHLPVGAFLLAVSALLVASTLPVASTVAAQSSSLANPPPVNPPPADSSPADSSLSARGIAFELRYGSPKAKASPPRQARVGDKTLHTLASMGIAVGTYYGAREIIGWPHRTSLVAAGGSALGAGLLKELYDRSKIGNRFSGADMVFNAIGTGMGIGVVVGLRES